jgi:hypothetical protein
MNTLLFRRMEGQTENFTPRGQNSPLGSKFSPRGEVKNGPLILVPFLKREKVLKPWRRDVVVSTLRTVDSGFESRQGVRGYKCIH